MSNILIWRHGVKRTKLSEFIYIAVNGIVQLYIIKMRRCDIS